MLWCMHISSVFLEILQEKDSIYIVCGCVVVVVVRSFACMYT